MTSGETTTNNTISGYVTQEQITLTAFPTGTTYSWGQTIPSGSAEARSELSSETAASVTFTPDVAGEYMITCTVDSSTAYTIGLSVTQVAASTSLEAFRLQGKLDSAVPAPSEGVIALYTSSSTDLLTQRVSTGAMLPIVRGVFGALLTDANATLVIGGGNIRTLPISTLTTNRTLTLGTTGAEATDWIEIVRLDINAFTLAVVNGGAGAGTLRTFPVSTRGGAVFKFDGTNWALDRKYLL